MRNTKSAFTLVELIVVITILAILGTIAFISLQGYSADARNSKRTSDLGNIQSAMSLKMVEGVPLMSFITEDTNNEISAIDLAWILDASSTYNAGTPSYTVLNVAAKDFKDPKGDNEYRIGGTTLKGGVFQLAAAMEVDGTDTAQVNGTYVNRSVVSHTGTTDGQTFTVWDQAANYFKVGDTVTHNWATPGDTTISKISRDGVTITLAAAEAVVSTATTLELAEAEEAWLIDTTWTATGVIVNLGTTYLPY